MTWRDVLTRASAYLTAKGVEDGELSAEWLVARLLGGGRGLIASQAEEEPSPRQLEAMRRGLARLVKGEPVQYVLGEWDFRQLTLRCDRRALIPRPETEELVTRVLNFLKTRGPNPSVIDVGTGTGAIALSLAKEGPEDALILGTDISEAAIALARENATRTSLASRVIWQVADGLDDFDEPGLFDAIVSNPPYIESAVCDTLDPTVRLWEPRLALDGGATGLDFYDRYLADALNLLKSSGGIFFEIGENQGPALERLMTNYGFSEIRIEKDYAGHDRYASAILV